MALGMNGIYGDYAGRYPGPAGSGKDPVKNHPDFKTESAGQAGLSKKAQELLKKLNSTCGNVEFMVADPERGDDVRGMLANGNKEFSVVFSSEELEKMASDEKYEQEYMSRVERALQMSEQINQEFGLESMFGKETENGVLTRFGVSYDKDGTMTLFAEIEKSGRKQQEQLEEAREEKQDAQDLWKDRAVKRTTVQAGSMEELLKNIQEIDWDQIPFAAPKGILV